jgi:hypothetical protein
MESLSFRQFLELVEKPTTHFSALADELDIPPEEFEKMAQVGAQVAVGKNTYNRTAYTIDKLVMGPDGRPTHAVMRLLPKGSLHRRVYQKKGKDQARIPDDGSDEGRTFVVPIDKVEKLMTAPWASMGDAGAMGAPPGGMGMPPGGGPMM